MSAVPDDKLPDAAPGDDSTRDVDARLNELLARYRSFLRSAILRLCPSMLGVTVDEIEQEALIRLWRALARERTIVDPASYLWRIAATAAIDAVRRVRARREIQLSTVEDSTDPPRGVIQAVRTSSPEQQVLDREVASRVQAALRQLSDNKRQAVTLHLRGFSSTEIGLLLDWTEPKARNLTHRGLKELRALLRREGIEIP
jgi:RNA polymerase sigma factor (sigma-70 family)